VKVRFNKSVLAMTIALLVAACQCQQKKAKEVAWFPSYDFDVDTFQKAPREFGPFTRWWLPGNDITNEELQREIKMLAENGFAGVEVQPLTMGLNPNNPKEQVDRVFSWDTPSFYDHLKAIMEQAKQSQVIVDMNGGSGWPLGGSFFDPNESMRTLAVSDTAVQGGQTFNGPVPKLDLSQPKLEGMAAILGVKNPVLYPTIGETSETYMCRL
jgi:predicted TIM-barrel fold metal-dependent hydrolase